MAAQLSLVLGGVRSGKSAFAEKLVRKLGQPALYLATGVATDGEMAERIRRHRGMRPSSWVTVEEPLALAGRLEAVLAGPEAPGTVLIDCLDVWLGNLLLEHQDQAAEALHSLALSDVDRLLEVCRCSPAAFFLVSSEVGLSLVPSHSLGRCFQDILGLVNQKVADVATQVYLVVAGIPVQIKGQTVS
jgi:adenosylcobinamide kinase/adenosylcobinamide-phosphate guanylyltransferase